MKTLALFVNLLIPVLSFSMNDSDSLSIVKVDMGSLNKMAKIYLLYQNEGEVVIDSSEYMDGYHILTSKINKPLSATFIADHDQVGISELMKKSAEKVDILKCYIHPGLIVIKTDHLLANAIFEVSEVNLDNIRLQAMLEQVDEQRVIVNRQLDSLKLVKRSILEDFINKNRDSFIALSALNEYGGNDPEIKVVEPMFNRLSEKVRNTVQGKEFYRLIENKKHLIVGSVAPEFTQNDTSGRPVSLSSFKGQYVLLDFWASWCAPCREENPNLRSIYKDFKDRNFTILGISLDVPSRRDAWLQAIKDDELAWTQVSDLKLWGNEVAKLYNIRSIPQNFLISPDGIIIAKGINSEELRIKLEKELPVK